jgi:hypothetical protein
MIGIVVNEAGDWTSREIVLFRQDTQTAMEELVDLLKDEARYAFRLDDDALDRFEISELRKKRLIPLCLPTLGRKDRVFVLSLPEAPLDNILTAAAFYTNKGKS